jgi:Cu(I)-responsive transcriptional regulator
MPGAHSIGTLAKASGCSAQTIRWYEQAGLLAAPSRSGGRHRLYDDAAASRLAFIRHARELGFSLEAIRELLALTGDPNRPCAAADEIASRHLTEIDARIARLSALRAELARMLENCQGGRIADCRVIEVLADHAHEHCLSPDHGTGEPLREGGFDG